MFAVDDASWYIDGADMVEGTSVEGIRHASPVSHEPVPREEEGLLQAAIPKVSGMSGTARLTLLKTLMMSVLLWPSLCPLSTAQAQTCQCC